MSTFFTPDRANPKDGPSSAGAAITLALPKLSLLFISKKIRINNIEFDSRIESGKWRNGD